MTPRPITYAAGATAPRLRLTVLRAGDLVDLTGLAITAVIQREGQAPLIKIPGVDPDPTTGRVYIGWNAGDLEDNAGETATYEVELELEGPEGLEISPDPVRFSVRPRP